MLCAEGVRGTHACMHSGNSGTGVLQRGVHAAATGSHLAAASVLLLLPADHGLAAPAQLQRSAAGLLLLLGRSTSAAAVPGVGSADPNMMGSSGGEGCLLLVHDGVLSWYNGSVTVGMCVGAAVMHHILRFNLLS